jgi:hypothetical protein
MNKFNELQGLIEESPRVLENKKQKLLTKTPLHHSPIEPPIGLQGNAKAYGDIEGVGKF